MGKTQMDDYKDYPPSITEIKSDKTQNGKDWTPRDALIAALRDVDSGILKAEYCILIFGEIDEEDCTFTKFFNSTPNRYILQGMIEDFKRRLIVREVTGQF